MAYQSLNCPFFFLSNKIFCYKFLSFYFRQGLKSVYMMRTTKCITENKTKVLRFIFARILKCGTKLGNEQLYCVLKNQPHIAYQFVYLSIFLSL